MTDKQDAAGQILSGIGDLDVYKQIAIYDASKANIDKGMGNWVDALVVASGRPELPSSDLEERWMLDAWNERNGRPLINS